MVIQKTMADEVKVPDQRHEVTGGVEAGPDFGYGACGGIVVDRNSHKFAARIGEQLGLLDRSCNVRRVGVGHRLDDDWRASTDIHAVNVDLYCLPSRFHSPVLPS